VCHAVILGLDLLLGPVGAGETAVWGGRLDGTALRTVVQCSPGGAGGHGHGAIDVKLEKL